MKTLSGVNLTSRVQNFGWQASSVLPRKAEKVNCAATKRRELLRGVAAGVALTSMGPAALSETRWDYIIVGSGTTLGPTLRPA